MKLSKTGKKWSSSDIEKETRSLGNLSPNLYFKLFDTQVLPSLL